MGLIALISGIVVVFAAAGAAEEDRKRKLEGLPRTPDNIHREAVALKMTGNRGARTHVERRFYDEELKAEVLVADGHVIEVR